MGDQGEWKEKRKELRSATKSTSYISSVEAHRKSFHLSSKAVRVFFVCLFLDCKLKQGKNLIPNMGIIVKLSVIQAIISIASEGNGPCSTVFRRKKNKSRRHLAAL